MGHRDARAPTDRLGEAHPPGTDLRLGPDLGHGYGGHAQRPSQLHLGDADPEAPRLAVADDPAVVHLDPPRELVGEAEPVGRPQLLELLSALHHLWGRVVVVERTDVEGGL